MEELIVPGIIFVVLAVIVIVGLKASRKFKPWENWAAVAAEWDFEFDRGDRTVRHMSIDGVTEDGIAVKVAVGSLGALEAKQHKTDIWLTLPTEIPQALRIEKAVSGFNALQRAKKENPHDPSLSLIWKAEGLGDSALAAIMNDEHCRQRLTNLYMAYPHAKLEDGELYIETLGILDGTLSNTVKLSIYLARDLTRVGRQM